MRQLPILVVLLSLTAFANGFQHNNVVCPIYKAYDPFVTPNATYTNPNNGPAHSLWAKILSLKFGYKFIYNNPQLLQQYADDYGHIVHEVPKAVFRPHSTDDVVEFVKTIKKLSHGNQKLQIVLRGASGNVEGAAQADTTEILVDFSCGMTDVQVNTNTKTVWAEVGALWEDVRASAFNVGLRPYIMPDYLGITIGGTASIGGLGPETPFYGSTADNILQLEVVTLDGKKIRASPNENSLIFTAARGGMGNFFLITRVQYRLKDYVPNTRIFHVLTPHYQAAITDIIRFVKSNEIYLDGVQMFLSANDLTSFVISVGPQILDPSLAPYVDAVLATNQTWAYVMELTIRYSENSPLNVTDIQNALSPIHDKHLVFSTDYTTDVWDRRLYIFTIPALIQIGNWYKRHPWLNVFFSETSARNVLPSIINPMDIIKETGGGHVSLYPYPRSVFTSPFMAVPQDDDYVFLMVVGRDEITDTPQGLQYMENSNRYIWDTLKAAGHATLYPSNYIPHFNANDWKEHFGPRVWEEYKLVKKLLDPKFLLADERNFGFATSVY